jgi:hypothetical protein
VSHADALPELVAATPQDMLDFVLRLVAMHDPLLGTRGLDARHVKRAARRAQSVLVAYRRLTGLHDDDLTLASAWLDAAIVFLPTDTKGD